MAFHLVGVDLGGSKIATALTDTDSTIEQYETVPVMPGTDAETIAELMLSSIRRITAHVRPESVLGVGVAISGLVEPRTGRVLFSPNLRWEDVPLRDWLTRGIDWPIYVANDMNMAALGELYYGAARGKDHVVAISLGTGVGGGLVLNGQLYQGAAGLAGEVGQMSVKWDGVPCIGGNRGCLEAYVSGTALIRRAELALETDHRSCLKEVHPLTVEQIGSADLAGDGLARAIVDQGAEILGTAIANLTALLNPELIVLGGGVIRGIPRLYDETVRNADERTMHGAGPCRIVKEQLGREAPVIGATVFAKLAGHPEKSHR